MLYAGEMLDGRLLPLFPFGGACKALHGLDQQAGGTGMDAAGILNSVLKFLHNHFLLTT